MVRVLVIQVEAQIQKRRAKLEALADILPEQDIQRNKERISKIIIKKIVAKEDDGYSERGLVKELIAECLNKYFARLELESEVDKLERRFTKYAFCDWLGKA